MRLYDQEIGRQFHHCLQHAMSDSRTALDGLERLGGAGKKDAEPSPRPPAPFPFRRVVIAICVGGIRPHFDKRSPLLPARQMPVVPNVAAHAAQAIAQRASAVRLERVRADRHQESAGAREDVGDGGMGDDHWKPDIRFQCYASAVSYTHLTLPTIYSV